MFAIRNKRSMKWLYGTDYRWHPPHQRTSEDKLLIFEDYEEAESQFRWRKCGKDYEVVAIRIEAL